MGWLPTYLYSSNECYQDTCGSQAGYSKIALLPDTTIGVLLLTYVFLAAWSNLTITLSAADKSFGNTLELTGATGKLTTSDNGKTWTGDIKINADKFPASN